MSKVVLVTGATSGIGRSTADYLFEKGYTVYGTGRSPDVSVASKGYSLLPMCLSDEDSMIGVLKDIIDREGRLDILINNAGQGITGALEDTSIKDIRSAFQVNFFGTVQIIQKVLPTMRSQKSGRIINITSIAAYMGLPFRGVYCASKAALEILTETFRMEVKPFGIHVTNLAPGSYRTGIASKRYTTPLTEGSPYMTTYNKSLQIINDNVNNGRDAYLLAKKVHKIINAKSPKGHYKSGKPLEEYAIILKKFLSCQLFEKLLMNHFKLK